MPPRGKLPVQPVQLVPTQFGSWRTAVTWAYHVARVGHVKTKVKKINGKWCAWRQL